MNLRTKPCRQSRDPEGRKAFTLIELLVVIAIIAILASMLLPALARAKLRAQAAQCISNQKQLSMAWIMYADENEGQLPPNGSTTATVTNAWIKGQLTWTVTDANYSDNINTSFLTDPQYALLAPYSANSAGVYKCPGDKVECDLGPRVRSYSMNNMMNGLGDAVHMNIKPALQYRVYRKTADLTVPGPANTWVFVDEHADSINDGFFWVNMFVTTKWADIPASYHGSSGAFGFADGHAEIKKWTDDCIRERPVTKSQYSAGTGVCSNTNDLYWVQSHTTAPVN